MPDIEQIKIDAWVNREENLIASRLFLGRTGMGIERGELATLAGISEAELACYENGAKPIPASILLTIAKITGIDINYFYSDETEVFGMTQIANADIEMLPG